MTFKIFAKILVAVVSLAFVSLATANFLKAPGIPGQSASSVETHSLTGLPGKDSPILVVKIDDTSYAHPQVGLRDSDVVYIEQVEGGLTRLAAIFSSKVPDVIGPVRSARISDIELMAQYGKVAFAYSGAQSKFLPVLRAANIADVGATRLGPTYYANDSTRVAPYAMMLNAATLMEKALIDNPDISLSKRQGWEFGDPDASLRTFASASFSWPAARYGATWSKSEKRWLLSHNGSPNFDESGYQLGPKTIVIQMVSITDSIYHDKVGGVTPLVASVGSGDCYILRDGGVIKARWNRSAPEAGTTFTNAKGEVVTFDRGQIWFALTSKEPVFEGLVLPDATPSPSK